MISLVCGSPDYFEIDLFLFFHCARLRNDSHGIGDTALLPNGLAEIVGRDVKLIRGRAFSLFLLDADLFRNVHYCLN
jgi:hypothetical protein